ncbi:MAG: four helix bundle protein [Bacteroidales bacterium]
MPQTDLLTRTFAFACQAVALYRQLVRGGGAGRVLARQFLNAATSLGANEEEAQAAGSHADFIAKQAIALREARESCYWLRLFEHTAIGSPQAIAPMRREAGELVAILSTVVKNARANARNAR